MEELYKYVNIPNFEYIQQELLNSLWDYEYKSKGLHAANFTEEFLCERCPTLMSWLKLRSKSAFRLLRFYFTPGYGELSPHIDSSFITVPFGLNIPVLNCENTKMIWYNCSPQNQGKPEAINGYLQGIQPLNSNILEVIDQIELVKPCFIKGDVMHSVKNFHESWRIMFTVRWGLHPIKFRKIEDVIDTTDLFV